MLRVLNKNSQIMVPEAALREYIHQNKKLLAAAIEQAKGDATAIQWFLGSQDTYNELESLLNDAVMVFGHEK